MYNQKKKRMIKIAICTTVAVIVLILAGLYIFLKTDLFRSDDELFFKYANLGLQDLKFVGNKQISEIEELKEQKDYKIDGTINYSNEQSNSEQVKADVKLQIIASKKNDFAYSKINLLKNEQSIFGFDFAKSNNIFAVKADEIANAYIGIQNDNLQSLASNLGIQDTTKLPLNVNDINIKELLNLSEEEKSYILETYVNVIRENVGKNNFTKEGNYAETREGENYSTTAHRLTLSAQEVKQVKIAILKKLAEDDVTLNIIYSKAKILGLEEEINIDSMKRKLQEQIILLENQSEDNEGGISIIICETKGRVITTQILVNNEIKFTIYGSSSEELSKRYILMENLDIDAEYSKIEINQQEKREEGKSVFDFNVKINDKTTISANLETTGTAQDNRLNASSTILIDDEENNQNTITSSWNMSFGEIDSNNMIKLDNSNTAILNNYQPEKLQNLIQALSERTMQVITEKISMLSTEN